VWAYIFIHLNSVIIASALLLSLSVVVVVVRPIVIIIIIAIQRHRRHHHPLALYFCYISILRYCYHDQLSAGHRNFENNFLSSAKTSNGSCAA